MKRTCIGLLLCMCIALTGCASTNSAMVTPLRTALAPIPTPMSTHPEPPDVIVESMGSFEAFTKHAELRELFKQVAYGSMAVAGEMGGWNFYSYCYDGTNGYYTYNKRIPEVSVRVDKKTADAVNQLEAQFPVGIEMYEFKGGQAGRMCVYFTNIVYKTGEDAGYYEDQLFYSTADLSDINQHGYTEIGGGWWFASQPMVN